MTYVIQVVYENRVIFMADVNDDTREVVYEAVGRLLDLHGSEGEGRRLEIRFSH